jgi:hypothetical protein
MSVEVYVFFGKNVIFGVCILLLAAIASNGLSF